jgi:hypothetical protein
MHQGDVSVYVKNVDLISLRKKYNYMEHEGKTTETDGTQISTRRTQYCWHR